MVNTPHLEQIISFLKFFQVSKKVPMSKAKKKTESLVSVFMTALKVKKAINSIHQVRLYSSQDWKQKEHDERQHDVVDLRRCRFNDGADHRGRNDADAEDDAVDEKQVDGDDEDNLGDDGRGGSFDGFRRVRKFRLTELWPEETRGWITDAWKKTSLGDDR